MIARSCGRLPPLMLVVLVGAVGLSHPRVFAQSAQAQLTQAREALRGEDKDLDQARRLLIDLVERQGDALTPTELCQAYVYLGYIEDLEGKRQRAVRWFERAATMEGEQLKWIRAVAETGLKEPVKWIQHLGAAGPPEQPDPQAWKRSIVERIGRGVVAREQPPPSLRPSIDLPQEEFIENYEVLCEAIDRHFSFFEHKQIDWAEVTAEYRPKVAQAQTAKQYYALLESFVGELKDSHSRLCNYSTRPHRPRFTPGAETRGIGGQLVVTEVLAGSAAERAGLTPGTVIEAIDDVPVERAVRALADQVPSPASH
jgi:hypothetical protein